MDKVIVADAVKNLLIALGQDAERPGLLETPMRVAKMYEEVLGGYAQDPDEVLKFFDEDFTEDMVVVRDINFHSLCEHHLLPFYGVVHICYIPAKGKLLGLSKLARVVDLFAKRLQLQEKMGSEIADFLTKEAGAIGVGVVIKAEHLCMSMRGVSKIGTKTVTTALRGELKNDPQLRQEALSQLGGN